MLFIDIETVPDATALMWDSIMKLYEKRFDSYFSKLDPLQMASENQKHNHFMENAGLMAEFGKIVCVSMGALHTDGKFYIRSIASMDEKELLGMFADKVAGHRTMCGHNIKEFDLPFLFRRFLVHGLPIPGILNTYGKKPWETPIEDTLEMWSSTQWRHRCSLELLATILGIPSLKEGMDGSQLAGLYYGQLPVEEKLKKISHYCNGDVLTTARVYQRMRGLPNINDDQVKYL